MASSKTRRPGASLRCQQPSPTTAVPVRLPSPTGHREVQNAPAVTPGRSPGENHATGGHAPVGMPHGSWRSPLRGSQSGERAVVSSATT